MTEQDPNGNRQSDQREQHQPTDARDAELHEIAEETSHEVQPEDPWTEPPNSTVDDWFGQRVQADADRVERGEAPADVPADDIDGGN